MALNYQNLTLGYIIATVTVFFYNFMTPPKDGGAVERELCEPQVLWEILMNNKEISIKVGIQCL